MIKVLDESGLPALWEAVINTCPRMEFGSYSGTGGYGSSNPNTLTFDFAPYFLMIFNSKGTMHAGNRMDYDDGSLEALPAIGCPAVLTTEFVSSSLFVTYQGMYAKKSEDGKTVSWYSGYSAADYQMNSSGTTYYYLAFG